MCDRGILEANPNLAKLDYCIVITPELIKDMEDGIGKLIGEEVFVRYPKLGNYPEQNSDPHRVEIDLKKPRIYNGYELHDIVVMFSLEQMPGCGGVLVSTHTYVSEKFRGKGVNTFLQGIKERIARENSYSLLMATVNHINDVELHILESNGWKRIYDFGNIKTYNDICIWVKEIK